MRHAEGSYEAASELYGQAIPIFEQLLGPRDPILARARYNQAATLIAQRQYAAAQRLFEELLQQQQELRGSGDPALAKPLLGLAAVNVELERFSEAEPHYHRAISLLAKTEPLEKRALAFAIGIRERR